MNLKQKAAEAAASFIQTGMSVGLGAGATMAYMVSFLEQRKHLHLSLYSSSGETKNLLLQKGFAVGAISGISHLDFYFDGCDQFDIDLNALKSGGGIHTMEKLLASIAEEFVLVGDEPKYSESLTTAYPVVLEVLPEAKSIVQNKVSRLFDGVTFSYRCLPGDKPVFTTHGNLLLDVTFSVLPRLSTLNQTLKSITGVIETSLFYNLATKAVIAGENGIQIFEKKSSVL